VDKREKRNGATRPRVVFEKKFEKKATTQKFRGAEIHGRMEYGKISKKKKSTTIVK